MLAVDVLINCVLVGVRLIVLTEGVIVIAEGSGGELLATESPFVSLIVELLVNKCVLLINTGLDVSGVTFVGVLVDVFATVVDLVGVTGELEPLDTLLTGVELPALE